jgi:hypothetical protein
VTSKGFIQTYNRRGTLIHPARLCSILNPVEVKDEMITNAMANLRGRINVKKRGKRIVKDRCSTVLGQKSVEIGIANRGREGHKMGATWKLWYVCMNGEGRIGMIQSCNSFLGRGTGMG